MKIHTSWSIKDWVEDSIPDEKREYVDWNEAHYDKWGKEFDEFHSRDSEEWINKTEFIKLIKEQELDENGSLTKGLAKKDIDYILRLLGVSEQRENKPPESISPIEFETIELENNISQNKQKLKLELSPDDWRVLIDFVNSSYINEERVVSIINSLDKQYDNIINFDSAKLQKDGSFKRIYWPDLKMND